MTLWLILWLSQSIHVQGVAEQWRDLRGLWGHTRRRGLAGSSRLRTQHPRMVRAARRLRRIAAGLRGLPAIHQFPGMYHLLFAMAV